MSQSSHRTWHCCGPNSKKHVHHLNQTQLLMTFSSMALGWKVLCLLHTVWGTNLQNSEKNMATTLKEAHALHINNFWLMLFSKVICRHASSKHSTVWLYTVLQHAIKRTNMTYGQHIRTVQMYIWFWWKNISPMPACWKRVHRVQVNIVNMLLCKMLRKLYEQILQPFLCTCPKSETIIHQMEEEEKKLSQRINKDFSLLGCNAVTGWVMHISTEGWKLQIQ